MDRTGEKLPSLHADRLRTRQVVLNLMSNAIKYNRHKGTVWVDVEEIDTKMVRINIQDNGPGISVDKQNFLFQPFQRLGAETLEIEGTGIGLVLTKKLVEEMEGTIGFESTPGTGSTFWVDLPMAAGKPEVTKESKPVNGDMPARGQ